MAATIEKVSNNIPNDLAFNILSKLPVKPLKRFRCVCISWANLFENPHFMSMYRNNFLSKYDNDNACHLLKQSMPNTYRDSLFLLYGEMLENKDKLHWPPPFQEDDTNIFILSSAVNGTLCLYQGRGAGPAPEIALEVILWNPTTEEFKVIPRGFVDCPIGVDICVELNGFGYNPQADDYNLIRHFYFFEDCYWSDVMDEWPKIPKPSWQIYSLRNNSWRKLDVQMPSRTVKTIGSEVYLNGVCHWWGCELSEEQVLVSFNLSDEVFHTTPLDSNDRYDRFAKDLVVLNGSIAMITMYAGTSCFDISVLGKVGVKESWTKLFTIGPLSCVEHPIGVGNKGYIFFRKNDDELAWFDLSTERFEDIGVKGGDSCCQIVIYRESVLPIGGTNN